MSDRKPTPEEIRAAWDALPAEEQARQLAEVQAAARRALEAAIAADRARQSRRPKR
jgi:hypothetical protein